MRSLPESTKLPAPIAEAKAILHERGAFGRYPSKNALNVGLDLYACIFPRIHELTVEIARLPASDQDAIHDFVLRSVRAGEDIGAMLPKPATAAALLALAAKPGP